MPKKPEIVRYKFNKVCIGSPCWKLQNTDERNQRPKQMERYTMTIIGKDSVVLMCQSFILIRIKIPAGIKADFKIYM